MTDKSNKTSLAQELAAEALVNRGDDRHERLLEASDALRKDMERHCLQIRELILAQSPVQFLAYLWAQFHMGVLADLREQGEDYRPNKELISTFQFALE